MGSRTQAKKVMKRLPGQLAETARLRRVTRAARSPGSSKMTWTRAWRLDMSMAAGMPLPATSATMMAARPSI